MEDALERREEILDDVAEMRAAFQRIWEICHVPTTPAMRAYTHFQRDFDEIRTICAKWREIPCG